MVGLPTIFWQWLGSMKPWQWSQCYDDRFCYGHMTTNLIKACHIDDKDGTKKSKTDEGWAHEVPPVAFEMLPDHSLRRHLKGRPHITRIHGDMDVRKTGEPKHCGVCRTSGHKRPTCLHRDYCTG
ncbi:hypothetical protein GOBAR_DD35497 [Gossypium barbadense]|nr:hypothetical protein GOBAR_DD35497 [Gossypium barbadense]